MSFWRAFLWVPWAYRQYTRSGYERAAKNWDPKALEIDLRGKVYLVTGANAGIGLAAAEMLAKRGGSVHMICRNRERGEKAQQEVVQRTGNRDVFLHVLDLSRPSEIKSFAEKWKSTGASKVDALINNAGVLLDKRTTTPDGLDTTFATNTLGTFLMTNLMLPFLEKSGHGRVIAVSSGGMYPARMDCDWNFEKMREWDGVAAYSQTKRQQVYLTELWAKKCDGRPLRFYAMHPGWVDTPGVQTSIPGFYERMKNDLRDIYQGADTMVWLAISPDVKDQSGLFYQDRSAVATHLSLAFTKSSNEEIDSLWTACSKFTGWNAF